MTEETARGESDGGPGAEKGIPGDGVRPREKWANKWEFMLSMAGQIIGLGNIWRFPYLCYRNGGGAFLIPYFVALFFVGMPLFILETALGQYTSEGGVTAWRKICPMFEGVGIASQVIVAYVNIYYIVILAWAIFYLYYSMGSQLVWSSCDNSWNTEICHSRLSEYANPHLFKHGSNWSFLHNFTSLDYVFENSTYGEDDLFSNAGSPEAEFWFRRVLRMSSGLFEGPVNWDLASCLLIAWILCYFCVFMGIKVMGKVVYFTATFPYLMLFILFIRGVTLPGAGAGIKYFILPELYLLTRPRVWFEAVTEVLVSYSMCQGVLTSMGSYNKYNNNFYRDCLLLCGLNVGTNIFAGFVVFAIMGFMGETMGVAIFEIAQSGTGLVFVFIPKALAMLPDSSFWAGLFFAMILFLVLDTHFVCLESLVTAITDLFPRHLRRPCIRELLVLVLAVVFFLLGLPLVSQGGIYLFMLIDFYGASAITVLFIASLETVVIAWVYGADRFYDNIQDMIGYRPFPVLKYCWLFITPLICVVTLLFNLANTYTFQVNGYSPGALGGTLGTLLILTPLICIPLFILITLCKTPNDMTTSSSDLRQAQPHKPILTLCKRVIFKAQAKPNRNVEENDKMMMGERSTV